MCSMLFHHLPLFSDVDVYVCVCLMFKLWKSFQTGFRNVRWCFHCCCRCCHVVTCLPMPLFWKCFQSIYLYGRKKENFACLLTADRNDAEEQQTTIPQKNKISVYSLENQKLSGYKIYIWQIFAFVNFFSIPLALVLISTHIFRTLAMPCHLS